MLNIRIKMSASEDTVEVDGQEFDRSQMTKSERLMVARMVTEAASISWGSLAA
jgi:hypothetical protein